MIEIKVDNAAVQSAFNRLLRQTEDMAPVMRNIGADLIALVRDRFDLSKDPYGTGWLPLKHPSKRRGSNPKPLRDTGTLAGGFAMVADSSSVTIGTNVKYAAFHNFGHTREVAAHDISVRHRTDAKGELLRTGYFHGKGLIFAKKSHKRALERTFPVGAHSVTVPARPFFPSEIQGLPDDYARVIIEQITNMLKIT